MRLPNGTVLKHGRVAYDPAKAHAYYLRTRNLKGRQKGSGQPDGSLPPPATSLSGAKARQRQELHARIQNLETKLVALNNLIRKKEQEKASENRKSKAKKERAAKAKDKPKTAAEKADIARQNKKYKHRHKQELKTKAAQTSGASSGGSSKTKSGSSSSGPSVLALTTLATKVKGQIAVAKQKLAAL